MKTLNRRVESLSKGDRLKWAPLKEAKPVPITKKLTKGRKISSKELSKKSKLLVP